MTISKEQIMSALGRLYDAAIESVRPTPETDSDYGVLVRGVEQQAARIAELEQEARVDRVLASSNEKLAATLLDQSSGAQGEPEDRSALIEQTDDALKSPPPAQHPVAVLVSALEKIERWSEFPDTGKVWEESGNPVSYGAAFGSNGERDYMRRVASDALAEFKAWPDATAEQPAAQPRPMQVTVFVASSGESRNALYEGQHSDETPEQASTRLHWVRAALEFERKRKQQQPAVPEGYALIKLDPRNGLPLVTNEMKIEHLGEYGWDEEAPYYDENGKLHDYIARHAVPWSLCKEIYKRMAKSALLSAQPQPSGNSEGHERAEFEAFAARYGLNLRGDGDLYGSHVVAWAWKSWRARAALAAQAADGEGQPS